MATSGVTAWSMTARDIITTALDENAIIALGDDPSATELEKCIVRLNALLKSLPVGEHHETTGEITIPGGSASGTLAEGIETILSARLVQTGGTERLLQPWGRDQYFSLPNKAASGDPTIYYQTRQLGGVTVYVWPVPTTDKTLKVDYVRSPEIVTDASQTVDFPERYLEHLYANLAVRCCGIFGAQPNPELVMRAQRLEREMIDADRPDSYFFESGCA